MLSNTSHYPDLGTLGEELVAQWLQTEGWVILYRRWSCRWGELDLIARSLTNQLIFVEVKTRSRGNWDADGLLAITAKKQAKLWKTAEFFLLKHPHLANLSCRFDVALVCSQSLPKKHLPTEHPSPEHLPSSIKLGQAIAIYGYRLMLKQYIPSAFEHS